MSEFQRVSGNNVRNFGTIVFDGALTRTFGFEVGYGNEYYNYDDLVNSLTLDRVVQRPYLEGHWQMAPQTVGVVGYQYEAFNYIAEEEIIPGYTFPSDSRNNRSHIGYVGVNHNFIPECSILANIGARYTDYYNSNDTTVNPYAKINLQYTYTVESYAQVGLTYYNAPTDVVAPSLENGITRGVNAFVLFGSITHRIVPDLFASLNAQFQNSVFVGGQYDGKSDQFYLLGLNLRYRFNHYLSADVGYNYDNLTSPMNWRDFNRNRVYFGVTGSY
jgi:hypothetical protein